jgi:signal transduction histidine kinase
LTTDLLDTARLEQGFFAIDPEVVDLAALVQQTTETMQIPEADVEVRVPEALAVMADPGRLQQALENLLGNARRHSPPGLPIVLEVSAERRQDGEWAVIAVGDHGPGIAPELLPRLFTRFALGTGSRGLGLGLYLARGIAEAHGGTLTVESVPGAGATFRLALPIGGALESAGPSA